MAHIINPVKVKESSDLFYAQPITFASMLKAKNEAENVVNIDLYTTQYEEDKSIIPSGFIILSNLERSVLDVNENLQSRKLPLIKDILKKLKENSQVDYFIYTNADIALMPYFYKYVTEKINEGHDALVINRRRLLSHYKNAEELPLMYADLGASHPGFDCFVFKRELLDKFVLADICVGISFIGVALAHNIFTWAKNPLFVADKHLTFHIGTDVLVPRNNIFYKHNRQEFFTKVYPVLKPHFNLDKFPYAALPWYKRAIKWMLNTKFVYQKLLGIRREIFLQNARHALTGYDGASCRNEF
ncbi:MAG: hypothetical protein LRY27_02145 [Chitinophagales bacterium]|nr:hypothetical protein [Chitinophagales bacterium]